MDLQAFAHKVFSSQPFTTFIGARLADVGPGSATIAIDVVPHLLQQHGFVHGGVLSYLADNTITFAGGLALGKNALTSEFKINYLRPAVGEGLIARSSCIHAGRSQAVTRCDVFAVQDGVEKLCATAQGTINVLPAPKA